MMKTMTSTALALALMAAPAFAQSSSQQSGSQQEQRATGQQQSGTQQNRQQSQQGGQQQDRQQGQQSGAQQRRQQGEQQAGRAGSTSPQQMVVSQQRVIDALNNAGFSQVRIMDAAYLVSAMTENDEEVMLIVNASGQPIQTGEAAQRPGSPTGRTGLQQGGTSGSGQNRTTQ